VERSQFEHRLELLERRKVLKVTASSFFKDGRWIEVRKVGLTPFGGRILRAGEGGADQATEALKAPTPKRRIEPIVTPPITTKAAPVRKPDPVAPERVTVTAPLPPRQPKPNGAEPLHATTPPTLIAVGSQVRHKVYGAGRVEQTVDEFGVAKAVVMFPQVGLRKVAAAHLKLEP